jgi:hypothetical protein
MVLYHHLLACALAPPCWRFSYGYEIFFPLKFFILFFPGFGQGKTFSLFFSFLFAFKSLDHQIVRPLESEKGRRERV